MVFTRNLHHLRGSLPYTNNFDLYGSTPNTRHRRLIRHRPNDRRTIRDTTLRLPRGRFGVFLRLSPNRLRQNRFFTQRRRQLRNNSPYTIRVRPVVVPTTLPQNNAMTLQHTTVRRRHLPNTRCRVTFPLLSRPYAPRNMGRGMTFFVNTNNKGILLNMGRPYLNTMMKLYRLYFTKNNTLPGTFQNRVRIMNRRFPVPLFLYSM